MGTREILAELQRKLDDTLKRHAHHSRLAEEAQQQGESLRVVMQMYTSAQPGEEAAMDTERAATVRQVEQTDGPERLHPLVEPIELVLADAGKPLHLNAIYDQLVKLEVHVPGAKPTNNISSVLSRHKDRFVNTGRGMWSVKAETATPPPKPSATETSLGEEGDAPATQPEPIDVATISHQAHDSEFATAIQGPILPAIEQRDQDAHLR